MLEGLVLKNLTDDELRLVVDALYTQAIEYSNLADNETDPVDVKRCSAIARQLHELAEQIENLR